MSDRSDEQLIDLRRGLRGALDTLVYGATTGSGDSDMHPFTGTAEKFLQEVGRRFFLFRPLEAAGLVGVGVDGGGGGASPFVLALLVPPIYPRPVVVVSVMAQVVMVVVVVVMPCLYCGLRFGRALHPPTSSDRHVRGLFVRPPLLL